MIAEEIGHSYFAKPILGREAGRKADTQYTEYLLVESSEMIQWYTEQTYVYQKVVRENGPDIAEQEMTLVVWLNNGGR